MCRKEEEEKIRTIAKKERVMKQNKNKTEQKQKEKRTKCFFNRQPYPIHSMYLILRLPTNEHK